MNTKLKICATVLAATFMSTASAGVVTQWSYSNQAGFSQWTGSTDTALTGDDVAASGNSSTGDNSALSVNGNNILDTNGDFIVDGTDDSLHTSLSWGFPADPLVSTQQSSLDINSPVTGTIDTDDWNWANGTDITHENWIIVGDSLETATILDGLTLTPTAWTGAGDPTIDAPYFAPQLQFGINFFETPNKGTLNGSGTFDCPDGGIRGEGDNINGCGDIFEITGLDALPFTPVVGPNFLQFTVPFVMTTALGEPIPGWSDTVYYVTTRLSGLTVLPPEYECESGPACFGFVTIEEQTNNLLAQFKVSTTVPEPTGIALFGLGLVALASRRRSKS